MELYLLRHAHAGDPAAWDGDDAARPLSKKGRRQAERLGELLAGIGFRPDALVSSTKVRARETATLVADRIGVEVRLDERLAFGFDLAALAALVDETGRPERLLLVGHDPDLSELVGGLVGLGYVAMRKGALARVDLDPPVALGAGELRWLLPPELLDRDA